MDVNHYLVLGLPSGKDGAKLSKEDIVTAYRRKCKELHPDKRPGDSNAHAEFLELQESYRVLTDESKRVKFDDMLERMHVRNRVREVKRRWRKGAPGFRRREPKHANAAADKKKFTRTRKFGIDDEIRRAVFDAKKSFASVPIGDRGVQTFTRMEKFDIDDIHRALFADIPLGSKGVQVSCCDYDSEIRVETFPLEGVWAKLS